MATRAFLYVAWPQLTATSGAGVLKLMDLHFSSYRYGNAYVEGDRTKLTVTSGCAFLILAYFATRRLRKCVVKPTATKQKAA